MPAFVADRGAIFCFLIHFFEDARGIASLAGGRVSPEVFWCPDHPRSPWFCPRQAGELQEFPSPSAGLAVRRAAYRAFARLKATLGAFPQLTVT
jgi:hypothetical protein